MVRETSRLAYREITEKGLLTEKRMEVYKALAIYGPCTAGELFFNMNTAVKGSVCARLTELREQGVVKEKCTKTCDFTKKKAIVWEITNELPTEFKKRPKRAWFLVIDAKGWSHLYLRKAEAIEQLRNLGDGAELIRVKEA